MGSYGAFSSSYGKLNGRPGCHAARRNAFHIGSPSPLPVELAVPLVWRAVPAGGIGDSCAAPTGEAPRCERRGGDADGWTAEATGTVGRCAFEGGGGGSGGDKASAAWRSSSTARSAAAASSSLTGAARPAEAEKRGPLGETPSARNFSRAPSSQALSHLSPPLSAPGGVVTAGGVKTRRATS